MLPRFIATATLALAVVSCGNKSQQEAPREPTAPTTASAAGAARLAPAAGDPAASGAPGDVAPAPAADRAAVEQLLAAWLAAQNGRDFAAYQGLYADKMEGVKRVGPRSWRFDRKGWLADRERMFKKPMTVTAREVQISGSAHTPVVELVQTFKQGTFSDEGPKRLVLTRGAAGLQIAREEMVRSVLAGAAAAATSGSWLPLRIDGKVYVVLEDRADEQWATGGLRGPLPGDGGASFAIRPAGKAPTAAAWKARQLAIFGDRSDRCDGRVGELYVISGGTPHFGEVQGWEGEDDRPAATPLQRARAVFDLAPPVLAAELLFEGDCQPVLVTDADSKAEPYRPLPTPIALETAAVAAFRKLPAYLALQRDYADNYAGKGPWTAQPAARALQDASHRLVVVSAKEGVGCGEFYGSLTAVFEEVGGKLQLRSASDQPYVDVHLVLDLDGDGVPELVGKPDDFSTLSTVLKLGASGYSAVRSLSFPFNDCGC